MHELKNEDIALVKFTINKHFKTYRNDEDMFQEGCLALLKAAKEFEPKLGYKFSTYAISKIYYRLLRVITRECWAFKMGDGFSRDNAYKIYRYVKENNTNNPEVIAEKLKLDVNKIRKLLPYIRDVKSLEDTALQDTRLIKKKLQDTVADKHNQYEQIDNKVLIEQILANLTNKEREVIKLYYLEEKTQNEISRCTNIPQVTISRLIRKGISSCSVNFNKMGEQ